MKRYVRVELLQKVSILRLSVLFLIFLCILKKYNIIKRLGLNKWKYTQETNIELIFPLLLYVVGIFTLFYCNKSPSKNGFISLIISSTNVASGLYFLKNCLAFAFAAFLFLLGCYYIPGTLIRVAFLLYFFLFYSIFLYFSDNLISPSFAISLILVSYHFISTVRTVWKNRKTIRSTLRNAALLIYRNICLFAVTLFLASSVCFTKTVVIFSIAYTRDDSGNFALNNTLHVYFAIFLFLFSYFTIANFAKFFIFSAVQNRIKRKKNFKRSSILYAIANFHHVLTLAFHSTAKLGVVEVCEMVIQGLNIKINFFRDQIFLLILKFLGLFVLLILRSILFIFEAFSSFLGNDNDAEAENASSFLMNRSDKKLSDTSIMLFFKLIFGSIFLLAVYFTDQDVFSTFYTLIFNRMLISYRFPFSFIDSSLVLVTLMGLFFTISIAIFVECFRAIILTYQCDDARK